ncbi:MAG: hypothetical protein RLZZ44_1497, partial [Bacteroidota bacterium]
INFEASVPLFEEVKAQNNAVRCVFNIKDKSISCVLKIKGFHFKRDLMETHFNEIYMESDRYPRASFKGVIPNVAISKITSEGSSVSINGKIKIRGISQPLILKGTLKKLGNTIQLEADFELYTDDFKIAIPNMILPKVSKKVQTKINFVLK